MDVIRDGICGMRANDGNAKTRTRQRPAFLVENAAVESGMNRRHMDNVCTVHMDAA
jgi:hypothetical protein